MFDLYIHIEFADGFQLVIEKKACDYNNDFDGYIIKHGDIVHLDIDVNA